VFLLLVHGERCIKRVQRVAGGAWLLISDNPCYEKELIKPEDMKEVEILGRFIHSKSGGQIHYATTSMARSISMKSRMALLS